MIGREFSSGVEPVEWVESYPCIGRFSGFLPYRWKAPPTLPILPKNQTAIAR
jgi:hypothetical protein